MTMMKGRERRFVVGTTGPFAPMDAGAVMSTNAKTAADITIRPENAVNGKNSDSLHIQNKVAII